MNYKKIIENQKFSNDKLKMIKLVNSITELMIYKTPEKVEKVYKNIGIIVKSYNLFIRYNQINKIKGVDEKDMQIAISKLLDNSKPIQKRIIMLIAHINSFVKDF